MRSFHVLLGLGATLAGCVVPKPQLSAMLQFQWATAVLFGSETGAARAAVVRWPGPVRYLMVGVAERHRSAVEHAAAELVSALAGVWELQFTYVAADDARLGTDGFVSVHFVLPAAGVGLPELDDTRPPHDDADGWFTISWNDAFELTSAVVFIDPELPEQWLRHTVLEEFLQVLGLGNDSDLLRDSVVFEGAAIAGSRQTLSDVDRQLVRLLYAELVPGDSLEQLARAMQRSWRFPPYRQPRLRRV